MKKPTRSAPRRKQPGKASVKAKAKPSSAAKTRARSPRATTPAPTPANHHEAEALFRRTFDEAPVSAAIVGLDFSFTRVNAAFCQFLGYTASELVGRRFPDITHPDDIDSSRTGIQELLSGKRTAFDQEKRYIRKDGEIVWGRVSVSIVRNKAGQPIYLVPIIQDITARKAAEAALQESEKRFQQITEAVTDYIYTVRVVEGRAVETIHGPGCQAVTGYRAEEFTKDPYLWFRMVAPVDQPMVERQARQILLDQESSPIEHRIIHKNGTERWVRNTFVPHHNPQGTLTAYEGLIQDITERKQAEEALRISEFRWKFAIEGAGDGLWDWDVTTNTVYYSRRWKEMLGYADDEIENNLGAWEKLIHPDDKPMVLAAAEAHRTGKTQSYQVEHRFLCKDGSWKWIHAAGMAVSSDAAGNPLRVIGRHTDITERKRAEEAMERSEALFRSTFDEAPVGTAIVQLDQTFQRVNSSLCRFLGYTAEELQGKPFAQFTHPDDISNSVDHAQRMLKGEYATLNFEKRYLHKAGNVVWGRVSVSLIRNGTGQPLHLVTTIQDITEQKQAEKALRQKTALLEAQMNSTIDGILIVGANGTKLIQNQRMIELWKMPPEIADNPDDQAQIRHVMHKVENPEQFYAKIAYLYNHPQETSRDEIKLTDGTTLDRYSAPILAREGECYGRIWVFRDITARKLAEDALRESEFTLRESQAIAGLGSYVLDIATGNWRCSDVLDQVFGITRSDVHTVEEWVKRIHPDDQAMMATYFSDHVVGQHQPFNKEYRVIRQDNKTARWVHGLGRLTFDAEGRPVEMRGTIQDITERKLADEALRLSENQFRAMFEMAPIGIAQANPLTRQWLRVNPKMCEITGYTADEMVNLNVSKITHLDDDAADREAFQRVLRGETSAYQKEKRYVRKDGTLAWVNVNVTVLRDATDQPVRSIAMIEDITARKASEEALKNSEARLRGLFDLAVDGILIGSSEGICIEMNRQMCALVGRTREEMLGEKLSAFFSKETLEEKPLRFDLLRQGQSVLTERPITRPDGTRIIIEMHSKQMPDGTFHAFFHDITAQKNAEAALRASEERFKNLFQQIPAVAIQGYAADGTTQYWNHASEQLYGFTEQEAIGKNLLDLIIPPEMRAGVTEAVKHMVTSGQPIPAGELTLVCKNGSRVSVYSSHAVMQLPGRQPELFCIDIDLTERKQAEAALRESEEKFAKVFHDAPVWIAITDLATGAYIDVNEEALRVSGFTREEAINHTAAELGWISAENRAYLVEQLKTHGQIDGMEMDFHTKDGRTVYGWFKGEKIVLRGKPCLLTVTVETTERKRAEEALLRQANEHAAQLEQHVRERTAELEATNKELEAFSYSVSHDLRAPLRAIDGFSNILNTDFMSRLDQEGQRVLGIICSEAKRMGLLIDDLLTFSRMNRLPMQTGEIDMAALAQAVFDDCKPQAQGRELKFKLHPLPTAQGDLPMIRQVLMNLVSNAIKYTRPKVVAEIEIGGHQEAGETTYYIKDNGVGFDQRYADKLFGVFQRLHTEDEFEGTGVGLALVQRVIHRHGGRVRAEAKVNEGATFHFTLPT